MVAGLLVEQLKDGGWNCEVENGSIRSSFATTINVLEGLLAYERETGGSRESIAARHRGEEYLLERKLIRRKSTGEIINPPGSNSRFQPNGSTTCCAASNTSARSEKRLTRGWMKQSICSVPSGSLMVLGCWRTRIPARSTLRLRTAMVGRACGTLFAPYGLCAGTTRLLGHRKWPEQESRKIRSIA